MNRWITLAVALLVVVTCSALVAMAQETGSARDGDRTTSRSEGAGDRPGAGSGERRYPPAGAGPYSGIPPWRRDGRGPGGGGGGPGGWGFSEQDWDDIAAFMKQHSPRRWEEYQKLPADRQAQLQRVLNRRWRLIQWVRTHDPELYELQQKRWQVEDEVFGLTRELRTSSMSSESQIKPKLRAKIGELVDLRTRERQMRITRWEHQIAHEREMMNRETADREDIINKRMRVAQNEAGELGDPEEGEMSTTQESVEGQPPALAAPPTTAPTK